MSDFDTDVLIAGAGPTGLTLAVELARRGVACRIVDKADAPATESRALGIHARTMETFELMGVLPGFLEVGHKGHGVRAIAEGKEIAHVRLDDIDSRYPFVLLLSQAETERLLTEKLNSLSMSIERSTALTTFTQDADGVTSTVSRAGVEEQIRSRWIVGCDGAHSAVRHTLALTFAGAPYAEQFMLADVHVSWANPNDELFIYVAKAGLAAWFPLGGDLWRVVMSSNEPAAVTEKSVGDTGHAVATSALTVDEVRALVAERVDTPIEITDPEWTARFRIHRRIVEKLSVGRAFLAGDAADIHSPAGGQGMNTGIQSAHNLAWKLALVNAGKAPMSLLDSYNGERHPVELDVLRGTDLLTRMITSTGPIAHWVRDSLIPVLSHLDFVQHRITANVAEVTVGYRRSAIVEDHPVPGSNLRAGDHAPDFRVYPVHGGVVTPEVDGGKGIADLLDPVKYTLFVLSGPVIARPHPSGSGSPEVSPDVRGFGAVLPSFSGIGGATAFPIGGREPAEAGVPNEGLYRVVDAGKSASERFGDVLLCHLIVRDGDQTYGFDWPCDTWFDRDATLHERYGISAPSLYLIRPDGYIAFRSGGADAHCLLTYLGRMFSQSRSGKETTS